MTSSSVQPGKNVRKPANRPASTYTNVRLVLTPTGTNGVLCSLFVDRFHSGQHSTRRLAYATISRLDEHGRLLPLELVLLAAVMGLPKDL